MESRFLAGVFGGLKAFLSRLRRSADPLDALYERLAIESEQLVADQIEQFNQTPRHEP